MTPSITPYEQIALEDSEDTEYDVYEANHCLLCHEEYNEDILIYLMDCNHQCCHKCFSELIKYTMRTQYFSGSNVVKCPWCTRKIDRVPEISDPFGFSIHFPVHPNHYLESDDSDGEIPETDDEEEDPT